MLTPRVRVTCCAHRRSVATQDTSHCGLVLSNDVGCFFTRMEQELMLTLLCQDLLAQCNSHRQAHHELNARCTGILTDMLDVPTALSTQQDIHSLIKTKATESMSDEIAVQQKL